MSDWRKVGWARLGFIGFVLMLVVLLAVPEQASAIGCGGGLFGGRRAARQERRASRGGVFGRRAQGSCAGSSQALGCSGGRVEYVNTSYQAPSKQAPAKQAPACPACPTPTKVEIDYPQAVIPTAEHYVSMETPVDLASQGNLRKESDEAWDRVPSGAIEIPQW